MSGFLLCLTFPVYIVVLRRANPPSKGSYELSVRFVIQKLILKENRSEDLLRQRKKKKKVTQLNVSKVWVLTIWSIRKRAGVPMGPLQCLECITTVDPML
jgi:hypothetical protein